MLHWDRCHATCVGHFPLTVFRASSTRCLATTARQTGEVFGRATLGAIQSASLAVGLIGQGLALARGQLTEHAVKQVDRLFNQGIDVDALLSIGCLRGRQTRQHHGRDGLDRVRRRRSGDDHAVSVVPPRTGHAAGLADREQGALKNRRNGYEYQVLVRLAEILPADVRVRTVADRGFGDHRALPGADRLTEIRLRHPTFAATSRSPPPVARRARRPIGLAPVVAREHCAARRIPPRRIQSPPWSACGRRA